MENWKSRWDYLAVSNIVPDPGFSAHQLIVTCGLCGGTMTVDHRGGLCTGPGDPAFVCDRCGDAHAPGEMAIVRRLRGTDAYTVTLDGADPGLNPFALTCPICETGPEVAADGWHVVDTAHGQPVCQACATTLDATLTELAEQLNAREKQYQVWATGPGDAGVNEP